MQANVVIDDLEVGESSSMLEFEIVNVTNGHAAIATGFWTPRCGLEKGLNSTSKSNNQFVGQVFLGVDHLYFELCRICLMNVTERDSNFLIKLKLWYVKFILDRITML